MFLALAHHRQGFFSVQQSVILLSMRTSDEASFQDFAQKSKDYVSKRIMEIFLENKELFDTLPESGKWLSDEMQDFACSGKMLRGTLAFIGYRLFHEEGTSIADFIDDKARSVAASLELFQAGLLVHDDIMDHDQRRRGKPTFHLRIKNMLEERLSNCNIASAFAIAEAQGICVGDLFFFLGWQEISRLDFSISSLFARELALVTLAQIRDVGFGYDKSYPDIKEIIEVYRHKTARYTIVLPLIAGAIIAHSSVTHASTASASISQTAQHMEKSIFPLLEAFGESMGIVFQLQDDRLGLFGNEEETGKPIGSDLKEGKKTPYIILLVNRLEDKERERFDSIFASPKQELKDIEWIRNIIIAKGVEADIQKMIDLYLSKAQTAFDGLSALPSIEAKTISLLKGFMQYSSKRSS
ncbi:MAG: Heptaprenyl diphosphate synthase component 2 [Spirochaetes bacterium ADurb.Bin110]|nr:MAG: Heptaprenyl diphosphate synthase component 2 [Spirochaetes bacterium ADurb.Bin110]